MQHIIFHFDLYEYLIKTTYIYICYAQVLLIYYETGKRKIYRTNPHYILQKSLFRDLIK